jgi:predicted nucleic acid-binding protein
VKKAVADTSALVSMAFSTQLERIAQTIQLVAPEHVKKELEELSAFPDEKARAAKTVLELMQKKQIRVQSVTDTKKTENLVNKNIHYGEAECFRLAAEQKIPVLLMDDLNASYALDGLAKAHSIAIKISAAAIIELANQQKISKKQAKEYLQKMVQHRNWEKTTLEYLIQKYFP